jgi:hypothetical protein
MTPVSFVPLANVELPVPSLASVEAPVVEEEDEIGAELVRLTTAATGGIHRIPIDESGEGEGLEPQAGSSSTGIGHDEEQVEKRPISPRALIPSAKASRAGGSRCVTPVHERGFVPIGSGAVVVVSQENSKRPFSSWDLEKYTSAKSETRKLFWERAAESRRQLMAQELSRLRERDEVVQEARELGAEKWGLGRVAEGADGNGGVEDEVL